MYLSALNLSEESFTASQHADVLKRLVVLFTNTLTLQSNSSPLSAIRKPHERLHPFQQSETPRRDLIPLDTKSYRSKSYCPQAIRKTQERLHPFQESENPEEDLIPSDTQSCLGNCLIPTFLSIHQCRISTGFASGLDLRCQ